MKPEVSGTPSQGGQAEPVPSEAVTTERVRRIEERLDQVEDWSRTARDRSRVMVRAVMPDETVEHLRNAGREQLLAVRSLVDFWIGRLEAREPAQHASTGQADTIKGKPSRHENIRVE